jgi:hypothetical protein
MKKLLLGVALGCLAAVGIATNVKADQIDDFGYWQDVSNGVVYGHSQEWVPNSLANEWLARYVPAEVLAGGYNLRTYPDATDWQTTTTTDLNRALAAHPDLKDVTISLEKTGNTITGAEASQVPDYAKDTATPVVTETTSAEEAQSHEVNAIVTPGTLVPGTTTTTVTSYADIPQVVIDNPTLYDLQYHGTPTVPTEINWVYVHGKDEIPAALRQLYTGKASFIQNTTKDEKAANPGCNHKYIGNPGFEGTITFLTPVEQGAVYSYTTYSYDEEVTTYTFGECYFKIGVSYNEVQ